MRIGTGFDVHKLDDNRKLILGGVEIPFSKGLQGHSDGDVVMKESVDYYGRPVEYERVMKKDPNLLWAKTIEKHFLCDAKIIEKHKFGENLVKL